MIVVKEDIDIGKLVGIELSSECSCTSRPSIGVVRSHVGSIIA
jgi:hypothetical protein